MCTCMFIADVHVTYENSPARFGNVDEGSVGFCEILKFSIIHCEPQSERYGLSSTCIGYSESQNVLGLPYLT